MSLQSTPIRVAVAEDHPLTRAGLKAVISDHPALHWCGDAENAEGAVALYDAERPDVLLVDLWLPDRSGVEVVHEVLARDGKARVIVLTGSSGSEAIHRAFQAGARGYLLKTATPTELVEAIRDVFAGRRVVPPSVAQALAERAPGADLTEREMDVLSALVRGGTNKEIALSLAIGEATVRTHIGRILEKLGVEDRAAAVAAALRRGIIGP